MEYESLGEEERVNRSTELTTGRKMACMLGWTVRRKKIIHKGWPGGDMKM